MNQRNFEYLKTQLKYTGFGEALSEQLAANIQKQQAQFTLVHRANYGKDQLSAALHFSKSLESDLYFFNNYKAVIQKPEKPQGPAQTFYIGREGANITLKEAFNLLDGRSVFKDMTTKEGRLYQAWLQLDFKQSLPSGNFKINQFTKNYGFDLISALQKLPLKEMQVQSDRIRIIESLQKGNRHSVTLLSGQSDQKVFIEANPQFKAIILYDSNYVRINQAASQKESQQTSVSEKQSEQRTQARGISR